MSNVHVTLRSHFLLIESTVGCLNILTQAIISSKSRPIFSFLSADIFDSIFHSAMLCDVFRECVDISVDVFLRDINFSVGSSRLRFRVSESRY